MEPEQPWTMQLSGLRGCMLLGGRVHHHIGQCITRWARGERGKGSLLEAMGHVAANNTGPLIPQGPWREQVTALCECRSQQERTSEQSTRQTLFPWDYISFGHGTDQVFSHSLGLSLIHI